MCQIEKQKFKEHFINLGALVLRLLLHDYTMVKLTYLKMYLGEFSKKKYE